MTLAKCQGCLKPRDYLLLVLYCAALFGVTLVSGRPLSVHESVLPQSAREMYADGDWVVPKKGGTPWLESPPLPQWITVGIAQVFGRCDRLWIVRLGPVLMATLTAVLAAWMASYCFGRSIGRLSGFVMATTCQFTRYAWLAEDEIFLCAVVTAAVALFVRIEFADAPAELPSLARPWRCLLGPRSPWVLAFFVVLGLTNLVKGLLFGTAMAAIPIAGYLLWNRDAGRILRFVWLWGWLAFAAVMLAWPLAAYQRYPDVLELWNYDLGGRLDGTYVELREPPWYYAVNLPWMLLPWTFVIPAGMWFTRQNALRERHSPERFLWCWAILVPLAFSIPGGKHHHYLLHALTPWAILSALGLVWIRQWMASWPHLLRNPLASLGTVALPAGLAIWLLREKIPGPAWVPLTALGIVPLLSVGLTWAVHHANVRLAAGTLFTALGLAYGMGHWYAGKYADRHRFDAAFLQQVDAAIGPDETLVVDMAVEPLRGFFCLFYLGEGVVPLHNLSFLVDERIPRDRDVYLITKQYHKAHLAQIADVDVVLQSRQTGKRADEGERLTLFRLRYHPDAPRVSARDARVSPMQAIYRTAGPNLHRF